MKKVLVITLIFLLTLSSVVGICFCVEIGTSIHNEADFITIKRIDHSIKNDSGDILALIYFDKPVFKEKSDAVSKIDEYFETEYSNWLNSEPNRLNIYGNIGNSMKKFLESLNDMREMYGDSTIMKYPLKYYVDTEVTFLSKDILSIKQYVYWSSGGPSDTYAFGSTFNLKTGELIPFTYFYDVSKNDFNDSLTEFLIQSNMVDYLSDQELEELLNSDKDNNFSYDVDSCQWNLSYEYYYDGTSIYLCLNQIGIHSGYIVKWNGKVSDEFGASMWNYNKKNDVYEEYQVYPTTDITT